MCALIAALLVAPAWASFAAGTGIARVPNPNSTDQGYGIALQSDGKIVVAGRCGESGAKLCVARLNADGSMDATFNANGVVPLNYQPGYIDPLGRYIELEWRKTF